MDMIEIIFLTTLILVLHAYFVYPLDLLLMGFIRKKEVHKAPFFPPVTMIITAYNEEKKIERKLQNTLSLEYPRERLQIIVASDGSTDKTNEIVQSYRQYGIELLPIRERRGKENAQKEAVQWAKGDVLVFTDVATMLESGGLEEIVSNFADPSIGCVSSEDRLVGRDGKPSGEGFYVQYEMWLRRLESRVNSLVGLSGSFFAARKEVCHDFSDKMQSDFRTLLNSIRMGLRGVSDPMAIGSYLDLADEKQEQDRKVRTVLRGFTVFFRHPEFLNFLHYGLFSYQYFCHKLLRWLVPFLLLLLFVSNMLLVWKSPLFFILFLGQLAFYGIAIWGLWRGNSPSRPYLKIPMYFVAVNISIFLAWQRYLKGERIVLWTPSQRESG